MKPAGTREEPHPLRQVATRGAAGLAGASALEILRWAVRTFGDRICVTSSMTDAVIVHMASAVRPGIDIVFLDTGYHFAETIGTRDAVASVYPVHLVNVVPSRTVVEQDAEFGARLFERDPDTCCRLRKVEPLEPGLRPKYFHCSERCLSGGWDRLSAQFRGRESVLPPNFVHFE